MPHCLSIPTPTPSPPDVNGFNLFADKTNSLPISDQQKKNFDFIPTAAHPSSQQAPIKELAVSKRSPTTSPAPL